MHVFQPYPIESIEIDPFTKLDKEWAEVVTKNGKGANAMTVSWGGFGTMFNKPVATLYVRESRYTRELLDQDGHFSLCFLDEKYKKEMAEYDQQPEDVLSYALFPQVATEFFKYRKAQQEEVDLTAADSKNGAYPV